MDSLNPRRRLGWGGVLRTQEDSGNLDGRPDFLETSSPPPPPPTTTLPQRFVCNTGQLCRQGRRAPSSVVHVSPTSPTPPNIQQGLPSTRIRGHRGHRPTPHPRVLPCCPRAGGAPPRVPGSQISASGVPGPRPESPAGFLFPVNLNPRHRPARAQRNRDGAGWRRAADAGEERASRGGRPRRAGLPDASVSASGRLPKAQGRKRRTDPRQQLCSR